MLDRPRLESPGELSELRKGTRVWLIDHGDTNPAVGEPQNEILPQVWFAATLWQFGRRAARLAKRSHFLLMLEYELGRPLTSFDVKIDS